MARTTRITTTGDDESIEDIYTNAVDAGDESPKLRAYTCCCQINEKTERSETGKCLDIGIPFNWTSDAVKSHTSGKEFRIIDSYVDDLLFLCKDSEVSKLTTVNKTHANMIVMIYSDEEMDFNEYP